MTCAEAEYLAQKARWDELTDGGMAYEWGLAGPDGGWFVLLPVIGRDSKEDVEEAKRYLYAKHDVVTLRVRWRKEKERTE
jgi:hypothetical protein